jgi:hypothetical protein
MVGARDGIIVGITHPLVVEHEYYSLLYTMPYGLRMYTVARYAANSPLRYSCNSPTFISTIDFNRGAKQLDRYGLSPAISLLSPA